MKVSNPDCVFLDHWIAGFRKRAVKLEGERRAVVYAAGARLLLQEAQEIMSAAQVEIEMLQDRLKEML